MTATQMLTAGLNAALRRPVVSGAKVRELLILNGKILPERGYWAYMPAPSGDRRKAKLVWIPTATS